MTRDRVLKTVDFVGFVLVLLLVGVVTNGLNGGAQLGLTVGAGVVWAVTFEVVRRRVAR